MTGHKRLPRWVVHPEISQLTPELIKQRAQQLIQAEDEESKNYIAEHRFTKNAAPEWAYARLRKLLKGLVAKELVKRGVDPKEIDELLPDPVIKIRKEGSKIYFDVVYDRRMIRNFLKRGRKQGKIPDEVRRVFKKAQKSGIYQLIPDSSRSGPANPLAYLECSGAEGDCCLVRRWIEDGIKRRGERGKSRRWFGNAGRFRFRSAGPAALLLVMYLTGERNRLFIREMAAFLIGRHPSEMSHYLSYLERIGLVENDWGKFHTWLSPWGETVVKCLFDYLVEVLGKEMGSNLRVVEGLAEDASWADAVLDRAIKLFKSGDPEKIENAVAILESAVDLSQKIKKDNGNSINKSKRRLSSVFFELLMEMEERLADLRRALAKVEDVEGVKRRSRSQGESEVEKLKSLARMVPKVSLDELVEALRESFELTEAQAEVVKRLVLKTLTMGTWNHKIESIVEGLAVQKRDLIDLSFKNLIYVDWKKGFIALYHFGRLLPLIVRSTFETAVQKFARALQRLIDYVDEAKDVVLHPAEVSLLLEVVKLLRPGGSLY